MCRISTILDHHGFGFRTIDIFMELKTPTDESYDDQPDEITVPPLPVCSYRGEQKRFLRFDCGNSAVEKNRIDGLVEFQKCLMCPLADGDCSNSAKKQVNSRKHRGEIRFLEIRFTLV